MTLGGFQFLREWTHSHWLCKAHITYSVNAAFSWLLFHLFVIFFFVWEMRRIKEKIERYAHCSLLTMMTMSCCEVDPVRGKTWGLYVNFRQQPPADRQHALFNPLYNSCFVWHGEFITSGSPVALSYSSLWSSDLNAFIMSVNSITTFFLALTCISKSSRSEPYDPYLPRNGSSSNPSGPSQGGNAKTAAIQAQIDDTVEIMRDNISKVAERGERLDSLQDKTGALVPLLHCAVVYIHFVHGQNGSRSSQELSAYWRYDF